MPGSLAQVLIVDEPTRGVDVSARNDSTSCYAASPHKMWLCCLSPPPGRDRTDGRSYVCDASGRNSHSALTGRDINVETIMRVAFAIVSVRRRHAEVYSEQP